MLELFLDATDLVQGEMPLDVVVFDEATGAVFGQIFAVDNSFDQTPAYRRIGLALACLAQVTTDQSASSADSSTTKYAAVGEHVVPTAAIR